MFEEFFPFLFVPARYLCTKHPEFSDEDENVHQNKSI